MIETLTLPNVLGSLWLVLYAWLCLRVLYWVRYRCEDNFAYFTVLTVWLAFIVLFVGPPVLIALYLYGTLLDPHRKQP